MQYFTARNFARSILARAQKKKKLHLSVTELETSPGGKKLFWNRARDNKS